VLDKADVLAQVCDKVDAGNRLAGSAILEQHLPFRPVNRTRRSYTKRQMMAVFQRDHFTDQYTGKKLVFPGTLRLLSEYFQAEFPYHKNWKVGVGHAAYYELCPTIDHFEPVTSGGKNDLDNLLTTSQLGNSKKAHYTSEQLNLQRRKEKNVDWDGLTGWFLGQAELNPNILKDPYLRSWHNAAKSVRRLRRAEMNR
jgi:hypothetical protein